MGPCEFSGLVSCVNNFTEMRRRTHFGISKAAGRAEIIEENIAELVRPIMKKYAPEDQIGQRAKAIGDDPSRVLVVLRPEKLVTN